MERDKRNVPGDFYVKAACCTLCGLPEFIAPKLFASDDLGCWVKRQPGNPAEEAKMLEVIDSQELNCIRYGGKKRNIIRQIVDTRSKALCDFPEQD